MYIFATLALIMATTCMNAADGTKAAQSFHLQFGKIYYAQCPATRSETLSTTLADFHIIVSRKVVSPFKAVYMGHFCAKANPSIENLQDDAPRCFDMLELAHIQQQETQKFVLLNRAQKLVQDTRLDETQMLAQPKTTEIEVEVKQEKNKMSIVHKAQKRRLRKQRLLSYKNIL